MRCSYCARELILSSAPNSLDQVVCGLTILRTVTTTHELIAIACVSSIRVQVTFFLEILIGFRAGIAHVDLGGTLGKDGLLGRRCVQELRSVGSRALRRHEASELGRCLMMATTLRSRIGGACRCDGKRSELPIGASPCCRGHLGSPSEGAGSHSLRAQDLEGLALAGLGDLPV